MPVGWLLRALDLRIGHYGPKFAALFFADSQPWHLFVQHVAMSWVSVLPLVLAADRLPGLVAARAIGALYGLAYHVAVNSLALPLFFRDPTPWMLGWTTIWPSLVGHMLFGAVAGFALRAPVAPR